MKYIYHIINTNSLMTSYKEVVGSRAVELAPDEIWVARRISQNTLEVNHEARKHKIAYLYSLLTIATSIESPNATVFINAMKYTLGEFVADRIRLVVSSLPISSNAMDEVMAGLLDKGVGYSLLGETFLLVDTKSDVMVDIEFKAPVAGGKATQKFLGLCHAVIDMDFERNYTVPHAIVENAVMDLLMGMQNTTKAREVSFDFLRSMIA